MDDQGNQASGEDSGAESRHDQQAGAVAAAPELKLGEAWGDDIPLKQQTTLEVLFQRQAEWAAKSEAERRESAFKGVRLTGAEVFWLAARSIAESGEDGAITTAKARLEAPNKRDTPAVPGLHLEGANLDQTHLEEAHLDQAHLEGAFLLDAHLEEAHLWEVHLERADLPGAHLEGADLDDAHLEGAHLDYAHLEGAHLLDAHLEEAHLWEAHLERADLLNAHLEGAGFRRATFDNRTDLTNVVLTDTPHWYSTIWRRMRHQRTYGPVSLADIHWNGADLTAVDWSDLRRLGDEHGKHWWWRNRKESEGATRSNIQLAKHLRDAGMNDDADRFAYRAQVCQRGVHLLRKHILRWLFSWLLFVIAGYGYRPLRTLFWYLAVIGSFAFAYYMATRGVITFGLHQSTFQPLAWYEALVLSVSSFHGRGFLPFSNLGDPVTILAAIEAVFGLFIEVSFIATFTQRFFGK